MRIVVTGGAGFIGANLCRHLTARGDVESVIAFDDLSSGSAHNLDGVDAQLVTGSILDDATLEHVTDGADAIVHLAAIPSVPRSIDAPEPSHAANATGTVKVLEAARRAGSAHVIVASSSSVYGANTTLPKRESMVAQPMSPYAVSKLAAEQYALAWQHSYALPVLAFRFFNVFGPLQAANHAYAAVIPKFIAGALAGEPVTIHGDGTQSRDFTFVDTVCSVISDALVRRAVHDRPVNLAFGTRTTLLEVLALIEDLVGHPVERVHVEPRAGDVPHSQADGTSLRSLFPEVAPTDLLTGISRTVEWTRSAR